MGMVGLRDVLVVAPAASFHPPHHQESLFSSADHPIIPLLTAAPCLIDDPHDSRSKPGAGIHLWQPQPPPPPQNPNPSNPNPGFPYLKKPMPMPMLDAAGILSAGAGGGTATCQDCGNQAKKDCTHRRCRTCCKSRGFDCSTHVKSTWVPAARRRERQISGTAGPGAGSSTSTSAPKKPRLISSQTTTTSHTSTSNTTPRSFDTGSSRQDASFKESLPGHVQAPALFKCVRVTSIDDGEDEYAYHAMLRIGGHVFKGFLYDQGVDGGGGGRGDQQAHATITATDTSNNAIPNISELHLGGGGGRNGASSSSQMLPSDMFGGGAGGGGLLGGTGYGNPIN